MALLEILNLAVVINQKSIAKNSPVHLHHLVRLFLEHV